MTRDEVYDAWAPEGSTWADWVKPVLFSCMSSAEETGRLELDDDWARIAARIAEAGPFAVVVELPGAQGVELGVCLSRVGYQPVPLYNALPHPRGSVELRAVVDALALGAQGLGDYRAGAPPAFLLDAARMAVGPRAARYDNRSQVLATDFPSLGKLESHGLHRVLLVRADRERPGPDLESLLLDWQSRGVELWRLVTSDALPPERYPLRRRPWLARARAWLGRASPRRRRDGAYGRFWQQGG